MQNKFVRIFLIESTELSLGEYFFWPSCIYYSSYIRPSINTTRILDIVPFLGFLQTNTSICFIIKNELYWILVNNTEY